MSGDINIVRFIPIVDIIWVMVSSLTVETVLSPQSWGRLVLKMGPI